MALWLYRAQHLTIFGLLFVLLVVFTLWQGAGQSIRLARMTGRFPLVDLARAGPAVADRPGRHVAG